MKAITFFADRPEVEVEILGRLGASDMFKVLYGNRALARHRDRLRPLDEEARKVLGKKQK